jgi:hypothetical protein
MNPKGADEAEAVGPSVRCGRCGLGAVSIDASPSGFYLSPCGCNNATIVFDFGGSATHLNGENQ